MTIDALRQAIERKDRARYTALLAEDIRFFTPIEAAPVVGREAVGLVLSVVFEIFQDFRYIGQAHGDGLDVLVFHASVGDVAVEGIDLIRLDADGLVREFTVMMRPLTALEAMSREMAARAEEGRPPPRSDRSR